MEEPSPKKKRGPKPTYHKYRATQDGAPLLATRVNPEAYEWARGRPEGTRTYLERIILEDKARITNGEEGHQVEESTSPDDVPGQLLLTKPNRNGSTGKNARKTKAQEAAR
jgi:hypothetical protein